MSESKHKPVPKTFCILPWTHQFVNLGGEYQVCCTSEEYDNNIRDDKDQVFNIKNKPKAEDVYNSKYMRNLRLDLLYDQKPNICSRCFITENSGGVSRRQIENLKAKDIIEEAIAGTQEDGKIDLKLSHFDYRLGNTCNLACRMCHPRASIKWVADWQKGKDLMPNFEKGTLESFKNYSWQRDPQFLEDFKRLVKDIKYLHFAGGEPLIIPQMKQMLKICIENEVAENIELSYNTNLTVLDPELGKLWSQFKAVQILISIDAVGGLNDYIRSHSKWSDILQNIKLIDTNYHTWKIREAIVSCTVQALNVYYLDELFDFTKTFKNIHPFPQLINLHFPYYYSTQILNSDAKIRVKTKLNKILKESTEYLEKNQYLGHLNYLVQGLQEAINFMCDKDESHLLKSFFTSNDSIDVIRKKQLRDHCLFMEEQRPTL